jgi:hypothetical protein
MSKRVTLLLVLVLTTSGLVQIMLAHGAIPKSSVPEFTVKFVDRSYDVSPSYSIDPYTGKNVTNAGYHVENRTIEVTIKNQPFTSYIDNSTGAPWNITLFYNVRLRGYYTDNWTDVYNPGLGYPAQSNSDPTVLSYSLDENVYPLWGNLQQGGKMDFQVQALTGYVHRSYNPNATNLLFMWPWIFTGETSDWSSTQTITISESQTPSSSPLPSQSPTATPDPQSDANQQSLNWTEISLFAALGVIVALLVVIMVMRRKQTKK